MDRLILGRKYKRHLFPRNNLRFLPMPNTLPTPTPKSNPFRKTYTKMIDIDLKEIVGKKIKLNISKGSDQNKIMHIRGVIDQEQIIYRRWCKTTHEWKYEVITHELLSHQNKANRLEWAKS